MSLLGIVGGGLLLGGAVLASREYSAYLDRRLADYRGLLALLEHARGMIDRYLSYGAELWRGLENEAMERCGLLPLLKEGLGLGVAFARCMQGLALSAEAKKRISEELSGLGGAYRSGELDALTALRDRLLSECESERQAAEKNKRIATALMVGGALAVLVMII